MERLLNIMKIQSALQGGGRVSTKIGLVDSYDPNTYSCKVRIQPEDPDHPEDSLSGWLPIGSAWAGNGFGLFAPPAYDQMVLVHYVDEDIDTGVVTTSIFNAVTRPLSVPQGECWVVHGTGSFLKFRKDGNIEFQAPTLKLKGDLDIDGKVTSTKDISDSKGSMQTMRTQHNAHTHQAQGPTSPTSAPITGKME